LPDVLELIAQGMLTRGDKNNRVYVGDNVEFASDVSGIMQSALFDPQTAGGLLISLPHERAAELVTQVTGAYIIGSVSPQGSHLVEVK
jgi:selenide,water dikinase